MGFIAKEGATGGAFKRVPPGVHMARCYSLIDLGTQSKEYQGEKKEVREIRIGFELFGEDEDGSPLTIEVEGVEMPMTITKRYTLSLHKKSSLRRDLAAWRGKDFTDEEARGFDVSKLMGAYCMLNVTHTESNGKTYANIGGVSPVPKMLASAKPKPVHPNETFDIDQPDMELFNSFYEGLQNTIMAAAEWQKSQAKTPALAGGVAELDDDDVPF